MSGTVVKPNTFIKRRTLDDFLATPVGPPHHEYEPGEIILLATPTLRHNDITDVFVGILKSYVLKLKLGRVFREVDLFLPDGRVYVPDFGFLTIDKLSCISPIDDKIHGCPTLVVEVLSQDEFRDRVHKFEMYAQNGVQWYWIVSQYDLTIEEYEISRTGYRLRSKTLPHETFSPGLFPELTINLAEMLGIEL